MANDSLAVRQNGRAEIERRSLRDLDSEDRRLAVIAQYLDLSVTITRQEWTVLEVEFWKEILTPYDPEIIAWAFQDYLRTAEFIPKPKDIINRIEDRTRSLIAEANKRETERQEQQAIDQARVAFEAEAKAAGMTPEEYRESLLKEFNLDAVKLKEMK